MNLTRRTSTLLAALSVTGLILTGCSSNEPAAAAADPIPSSSASNGSKPQTPV